MIMEEALELPRPGFCLWGWVPAAPEGAQEEVLAGSSG